LYQALVIGHITSENSELDLSYLGFTTRAHEQLAIPNVHGIATEMSFNVDRTTAFSRSSILGEAKSPEAKGNLRSRQLKWT
jgi:hypothetical protein